MSKRQILMAVGPGRPTCPTPRINAMRFASSEVLPGNRQRAQEKSSNTMPTSPPPEQKPASFNQQNFGRSRQQRSAQVSEEVRMLNRGAPSAKVRGNNSPYPATRTRTVDPSAVGQGERRGEQMGRNNSPSREGPFRQQTGRVIRAGQSSIQNRSERTPSGAASGNRVLSNRSSRGRSAQTLDEDDGAEAESDESVEAPSTAHELFLLEQYDKEQITPVPFSPDAVTPETYLQLGQGGSTIAGNNYAGVLEDRLKLLSERTQDSFRHAPDLASRMMKGHFISFASAEEKAAVVAAAEKYAQTNADTISTQKGGESVEKKEFEFAPVAQKSSVGLLDKLVRGRYGDLNAAGYKQDVLNQIARNTLRNPTYLDEDGNKLLRKIRNLLPAENAGGAGAARKPAAAKARK